MDMSDTLTLGMLITSLSPSHPHLRLAGPRPFSLPRLLCQDKKVPLCSQP